MMDIKRYALDKLRIYSYGEEDGKIYMRLRINILV